MGQFKIFWYLFDLFDISSGNRGLNHHDVHPYVCLRSKEGSSESAQCADSL